MKSRIVVAFTFGLFLVFSGISLSQTKGGCAPEMSMEDCVLQVAEIARGFGDDLRAAYAAILRAEIPVGTVLVSALPPEIFLSDKNPQFDPQKWVPADGRSLPANSIYQSMSGETAAPDLRLLQQQKLVLDVIAGGADSGQVVDQLKTPAFASANWSFHFGMQSITGRRLNNDYEQDVDHFQVLTDEGKVLARGRTLNWKHSKWGPWSEGGRVNYLGIATISNGLHYYVKIN